MKRAMRTVPILLAAVLIAVALSRGSIAAEPVLFQFEQQAQQHCPGDNVVWIDPARHFYNIKGERWYGATKSGAYLCLRDGEKAGYHPRRTPAAAAAE
jgi:hypothetical protein